MFPVFNSTRPQSRSQQDLSHLRFEYHEIPRNQPEHPIRPADTSQQTARQVNKYQQHGHHGTYHNPIMVQPVVYQRNKRSSLDDSRISQNHSGYDDPSTFPNPHAMSNPVMPSTDKVVSASTFAVHDVRKGDVSDVRHQRHPEGPGRTKINVHNQKRSSHEHGQHSGYHSSHHILQEDFLPSNNTDADIDARQHRNSVIPLTLVPSQPKEPSLVIAPLARPNWILGVSENSGTRQLASGSDPHHHIDRGEHVFSSTLYLPNDSHQQAQTNSSEVIPKSGVGRRTMNFRNEGSSDAVVSGTSASRHSVGGRGGEHTHHTVRNQRLGHINAHGNPGRRSPRSSNSGMNPLAGQKGLRDVVYGQNRSRVMASTNLSRVPEDRRRLERISSTSRCDSRLRERQLASHRSYVARSTTPAKTLGRLDYRPAPQKSLPRDLDNINGSTITHNPLADSNELTNARDRHHRVSRSSLPSDESTEEVDIWRRDIQYEVKANSLLPNNHHFQSNQFSFNSNQLSRNSINHDPLYPSQQFKRSHEAPSREEKPAPWTSTTVLHVGDYHSASNESVELKKVDKSIVHVPISIHHPAPLLPIPHVSNVLCDSSSPLSARSTGSNRSTNSASMVSPPQQDLVMNPSPRSPDKQPPTLYRQPPPQQHISAPNSRSKIDTEKETAVSRNVPTPTASVRQSHLLARPASPTRQTQPLTLPSMQGEHHLSVSAEGLRLSPFSGMSKSMITGYNSSMNDSVITPTTVSRSFVDFGGERKRAGNNSIDAGYQEVSQSPLIEPFLRKKSSDFVPSPLQNSNTAITQQKELFFYEASQQVDLTNNSRASKLKVEDDGNSKNEFATTINPLVASHQFAPSHLQVGSRPSDSSNGKPKFFKEFSSSYEGLFRFKHSDSGEAPVPRRTAESFDITAVGNHRTQQPPFPMSTVQEIRSEGPLTKSVNIEEPALALLTKEAVPTSLLSPLVAPQSKLLEKSLIKSHSMTGSPSAREAAKARNRIQFNLEPEEDTERKQNGDSDSMRERKAVKSIGHYERLTQSKSISSALGVADSNLTDAAAITTGHLDKLSAKNILSVTTVVRQVARTAGGGTSGKNIPQKVQHLLGTTVIPPSGITNKVYKVEKVVQTAIYGAVFLAFELHHPGGPPLRKIALKVMSRDLELRNRGQMQEDAWAEVKYRDYMKGHKNVLVFDFSWEDEDLLYIVMPFAEFGDLFELLKKRKRPLSEGQGRWMFAQVLEGADHLHKKGLAFRDHSLENILMFYDEQEEVAIPKITDPGQAIPLEYDEDKKVKEMKSEKLFGKSFRAPEVYLKGTYHPLKIDTFCLGWMLFFAVTRVQPFDRALYQDPAWFLVLHGKIDEMLKQKNVIPLSFTFKDLVFKMLNPDPRRRPTPAQCLDHPWFAEQHIPIDRAALTALPPSTSSPTKSKPGSISQLVSSVANQKQIHVA